MPSVPRLARSTAARLLQRLQQNEISVVTARERVSQAHQLVAEIEARLPPVSGKRIWERISECWDLLSLEAALAEGKLDSTTLMAIVALDVYLTKYFRLSEVEQETVERARGKAEELEMETDKDRAQRRSAK